MDAAISRSSATVNFAYCTVFTFRNVSDVCDRSKCIKYVEHSLHRILSECLMDQNSINQQNHTGWDLPACIPFGMTFLDLLVTKPKPPGGPRGISSNLLDGLWSQTFLVTTFPAVFPASFTLFPTLAFSMRELRFFPNYVVWPVWLVLGWAGLR